MFHFIVEVISILLLWHSRVVSDIIAGTRLALRCGIAFDQEQWHALSHATYLLSWIESSGISVRNHEKETSATENHGERSRVYCGLSFENITRHCLGLLCSLWIRLMQQWKTLDRWSTFPSLASTLDVLFCEVRCCCLSCCCCCCCFWRRVWFLSIEMLIWTTFNFCNFFFTEIRSLSHFRCCGLEGLSSIDDGKPSRNYCSLSFNALASVAAVTNNYWTINRKFTTFIKVGLTRLFPYIVISDFWDFQKVLFGSFSLKWNERSSHVMSTWLSLWLRVLLHGQPAFLTPFAQQLSPCRFFFWYVSRLDVGLSIEKDKSPNWCIWSLCSCLCCAFLLTQQTCGSFGNVVLACWSWHCRHHSYLVQTEVCREQICVSERNCCKSAMECMPCGCFVGAWRHCGVVWCAARLTTTFFVVECRELWRHAGGTPWPEEVETPGGVGALKVSMAWGHLARSPGRQLGTRDLRSSAARLVSASLTSNPSAFNSDHRVSIFQRTAHSSSSWFIEGKNEIKPITVVNFVFISQLILLKWVHR